MTELAIIVMDLLRVVLSFILFIYVSYKDLTTREVNDLVWIGFGSIGLLFNIFEIYTGSLTLMIVGITFIITVGFAFFTGYFGLFGEADLLAFITLGLLNPAVPTIMITPLLFRPVVFALSVISNSVLIGALSIIVVFLVNISSSISRDLFSDYRAGLFVKIVLLMTGINKKIERVKGPPFEYPLEKIEEDGSINLIIRPDVSDDEVAERTLSHLKDIGRSRVWVSFTLPFLFILGIGYVVTLFLGDVILFILSSIFGYY